MVVPQAQQADWRPAWRPKTRLPRTVTACRALWIASGTEAIRVARKVAASIAEGTIERDRSGAVPARPFFEAARSGVLPSNHGQI